MCRHLLPAPHLISPIRKSWRCQIFFLVRLLLLSASLAVAVGIVLVPTAQRLFARAIGYFQEHRSTTRMLLASATLGTQAPRLARDAQLRLKGFPDYTRLPRVPDFFIQLAAICVRLPQTLTELQAAFPGCDSRDIKRFAFLCATSGLGQLRLVAGVPVRSTGGPPRPATRVATHQGFFAALLHKLF